MKANTAFKRLFNRSKKSRAKKRRCREHGRRLWAEPLEDRRLLAGILSVSPDTALQGAMDVAVTFTLDSSSTPPPPPAFVAPQDALLGTIEGTDLSRDNMEVTATFDIPADAAVGSQDVSVSFPTPHGTIELTLPDGFDILANGVPTISIVASDSQASESEQDLATFIITRTGSTDGDLTVQLSLGGSATEGDDFVAITRTAVIPDGQSSVAVTLTPVDDDLAESTETVTLTISADAAYTTGTDDSATARITDDDSVTPGVTYAIVDTNQTTFFNNTSEISEPSEADAFYGQDANFDGNLPSYTLSDDGLTVYDNVTDLTWTQTADWDNDGDIDADDKFSFTEFLAYPDTLNAQNYGGYSDWRAPTIKELYSLMDFSGRDVSGYSGTDTSGLTPFIDTDYFDFGYGDTSAGERIIDAQFWSSTEYLGTTMGGNATTFGLNLADGRIKGYPQVNKDEYAYFVRGNTDYGENDFGDNGDGTVSDAATGLMWSQDDSGTGMDWEAALAWVQQMNDQNYLGHNDWRLPSAKELQSIVDYSRSPSATSSAAIDPVFNITSITAEDGSSDWPFFWSSTTHATDTAYNDGAWGAYVCFGEAYGYWMNTWQDVHGAGAQRSDPKYDDGTDYSSGHGPQGDAVRIDNFVRLVRDTDTSGQNDPPTAEAGGPYAGEVDATIALDGAASSDTDGMIVSYEWDLDNDGDYDDATGATADFSSSTAGTYTVGLRVTDDDGDTGTDTATITVAELPNVAPTADAGGPYSGTEGDTITLSASGSTDSDGMIASYQWDLDNDGQFDDATGATANFAATTAGTFTVGLRVTDDDSATDVDTTTVDISEKEESNQAPYVANPIADQTARANRRFRFTLPPDTFADSDTGQTLSYAATQADGTPLPGWLTFNAQRKVFSGRPTVRDVGQVNVRVTATDSGVPAMAAWNEFTISVTSHQFAWQNAEQREDVDGSGLVTPLDALVLVNRLNTNGSGPVQGSVPASADSSFRFFDVSGDDFVSPIDALMVVSHLNGRGRNSGEGESVEQGPLSSVTEPSSLPSLPEVESQSDSSDSQLSTRQMENGQVALDDERPTPASGVERGTAEDALLGVGSTRAVVAGSDLPSDLDIAFAELDAVLPAIAQDVAAAWSEV